MRLINMQKPAEGAVFISDYLKAKAICASVDKEEPCIKSEESKDKEVKAIDEDLKCEWTIKPQDYHRSVNRIFFDPKELTFKKVCAAATEKGIKTEVKLAE